MYVCTMYICMYVCVRPLDVSPLEPLFVLKTISRTQRAMQVKAIV